MPKKRKIEDIEADEQQTYWVQQLYNSANDEVKHNKQLIHHLHLQLFKMDTSKAEAEEIFKNEMKEQLVRLILRDMLKNCRTASYSTTAEDTKQLKARRKRMNEEEIDKLYSL